jgi:pimeloyl-ACP methyl ester carboxylesterase
MRSSNISSDERMTNMLAHDDFGGDGKLVVLLPGAGDLRSEYRFLEKPIASAGYRVVTADLPGHGDSPIADEYTVRSTAGAIVELIESLGAGPATVVGASFAPPCAVWAATDRPGLIDGLVLISPHLEAERSFKGSIQKLSILGLLTGPWAGSVWSRLYSGWYQSSPPADLAAEISKLKQMLSDPARRKAVRQSLVADRDGVAERLGGLDKPTLTIFGSQDDHFADPTAQAALISGRLDGGHLVVDGAGHYPHVEQPEIVTGSILAFLQEVG